MPVKMKEGNIEHETFSVRELISALQALDHPDKPIRALFDGGSASGDIKGIERRPCEKHDEYDIIVE